MENYSSIHFFCMSYLFQFFCEYVLMVNVVILIWAVPVCHLQQCWWHEKRGGGGARRRDPAVRGSDCAPGVLITNTILNNTSLITRSLVLSISRPRVYGYTFSSITGFVLLSTLSPPLPGSVLQLLNTRPFTRSLGILVNKTTCQWIHSLYKMSRAHHIQ